MLLLKQVNFDQILNKNINCNLRKYFLILLHKIVSYSLLLQ